MVRKHLFMLLLFVCALSAAQRYEWRDVVQRVEIQPNGDVLVEDERTLWTDEDFGEAFVRIRLQPGQTVELLEGSGAVSPGPNARAFQQPVEGNQEELVVRNDSRVSERRVHFRYLLRGSIEPYSDVVQWYWQILEREHPPIRGYTLEVLAPGAMAAPYDAYVHRFTNPEEPTVTLSPDRARLQVTFNRIPDGDGVEIRYLMNPALFTVRGSSPGFERLLEEEAEIAGLRERERARREVLSNPLFGLLGFLVVAALAFGIWRAYNRYGREPDVGPTLHYNFEPPSDLPPAVLPALLTQRFSGGSSMSSGFHATVMDLARRGYGTFASQGRKFEMHLNLEKSEEGLEPFEREVLTYLKRAAGLRGQGSFLEFAELKRYSEKNLALFMSRWGADVRQWVEGRMGGKLTTPESIAATNHWTGYSLGGILLCGLAAWQTYGAAQGLFILAAILCFILLIVANVSLPAWRREIAPEIYGWQGFKRTLSDFSRMKDAPDDFFMLWDRYYCYAAALGVAQQFLRNIQRAAPLRNIDERSMMSRAGWIGASNLSSSNFSSLSQSITSLSSALSSASASASSGGSSSGGGGGGGGGSSGGR